MPEELLAVTTRSRLRSVRFFPAMMLATRRIRRQLAQTDGLVRWASMTAGPREFWTITVWRSRHAMQEFMRSDAHGEIMWRSSRWLHSLWLMRWRPGNHEVGSWSGVTMAREEPAEAESMSPEAEALQRMLGGMPELQSALDASGVATYENTRAARRQRRKVANAGGVIVRLHTSPLHLPWALAELVHVRYWLRADEELLRSVIGLGRRGEVCLLGVLADRAGAQRVVASARLRRLTERWRSCWAHEWQPDNEFGHWDGLRVRQASRRRVAASS